MKQAAIAAIEYHLPAETVSSERLAAEFPEWSVAKIDEKTGISERHIAAQDECASDLAVEAASKLFAAGACQPAEIDYILFCTQSPDYILPTTACAIQDRLGVPKSAAPSTTIWAAPVLLLAWDSPKDSSRPDRPLRFSCSTGETYSKYMNRRDKSVRTIFGDAGAATLLTALEPAASPYIGPFVYGTVLSCANSDCLYRWYAGTAQLQAVLLSARRRAGTSAAGTTSS